MHWTCSFVWVKGPSPRGTPNAVRPGTFHTLISCSWPEPEQMSWWALEPDLMDRVSLPGGAASQG